MKILISSQAILDYLPVPGDFQVRNPVPGYIHVLALGLEGLQYLLRLMTTITNVSDNVFC